MTVTNHLAMKIPPKLIILKDENTIQNSASGNEKLSLSSSMKIPQQLMEILNCADLNGNGNIIKKSAEILDYIGSPFWYNINTSILAKHG